MDVPKNQPAGPASRLGGLLRRAVLGIAAAGVLAAGPVALSASPASADQVTAPCNLSEGTGPRAVCFEKTVDVANPVVGQTVTYTVTITNAGNDAYNGEHQAVFTDSLAAVLAHATFVDGSLSYDGTIGSASYTAGSGIEWHTTGTFQGGTSTTVSYQVVPTEAGGPWTNTVVSASEGSSNCLEGSQDAVCSAAITVAEDNPAPAINPWVAGGALVGAIAIGLVASRRRIKRPQA